MSLHQDLPVYKASYDLLLEIFRFTKDFSKEYKYTIGENIKKETLELLTLIFRANSKTDKLTTLQDARERIEVIRLFVRLMKDLQQINLKRFAQINQQIEEVSKQLTGWQKSLGGSLIDIAYSIQQTTDGGYIIAGYTESTDGDISGNHGIWDYWIVKLTSTGNVDWQKSLGGSGWDRAFSVQQATNGGYIIAGESYSNDGDVTGNHGANDYWIVKLTLSGEIEWQRSIGGSSFDWGYCIQQTTNGGYIIAGYSMSDDGDVSGNQGDRDYWIVKLYENF